MNWNISNKRTWIMYLAVVALGLSVFTAVSISGKEEEAEKKKVVKPFTYPTTAVQHINPEYEVSLPGELVPYEQVAVYAKISGFVKHLYVNRGEYVRRGQILAELEAPEMEQRYLSNKSTAEKQYSDYLYARQAYERLVKASKTAGAVADIELERAKNTMESAKSIYEAAQAGTEHSAQLQQYLRITAPFDGLVTHRNVSVGALTGTEATVPLFRMAQDDKLRLTLALPEKHAASVKQDMSATFTVSSQPGKTFSATLARTSGLLDRHDRSLKLEFDINNAAGELQGGDYAQVKLRLQRKNPTPWVPSASILRTQSGSYVMTLNHNEIKRIPLTEGIRLDTLSEVFGALSPGEQVLLKPSEEIREGQRNK